MAAKWRYGLVLHRAWDDLYVMLISENTTSEPIETDEPRAGISEKYKVYEGQWVCQVLARRNVDDGGAGLWPVGGIAAFYDDEGSPDLEKWEVVG